jgi:DNA repair exonuclease SbcCD ATPase subunit
MSESNTSFSDTQRFIIESSSRQARMEETLKAIQRDFSVMTENLKGLSDAKKAIEDLNNRFSNYTSRQQRLEQSTEHNNERIDELEKQVAIAYNSLKVVRWIAGVVGGILISISGYLFSEIVRLHDAEIHLNKDIELIKQHDAAHIETCQAKMKALDDKISRVERQ